MRREERYSNMKLVYMCRTGFKNGGLGERPFTENGGIQSGPSGEKQGILELKITKKRIYIFFKRGSFRSGQVGKAQQRIV